MKKNAVSLLESGDWRYIKAIDNNVANQQKTEAVEKITHQEKLEAIQKIIHQQETEAIQKIKNRK